jgi:hypothetical protein
MPPLEAVHGTEVAYSSVRQADGIKVLARSVAVPDLDAGGGEGEGGCGAGDKPEEFGDDGAQEDAFCCEEGEDGRPVCGGEGEFEGARSEEGVCSCAGSWLWLVDGCLLLKGFGRACLDGALLCRESRK